MTQATFYFDLGSPYAYLAAERISGTLPEVFPGSAPEVFPESVVWQPVSLGALFKLNGRSSWSLGDPDRREAGIAEVEGRARLYGLPPVRWPDPWPSNYLYAMRATTFAFQAGVGREFALRAFRHAFQDGHDLGLEEDVLNVAEQVSLDPATVADATGEPQVKLALREATDDAHRLGVFGVPTISVDGELFWGEDRLDVAAAVAAAVPRP
jgi:2-hydroxychromene-2-carboxylate isomerase